MAESNPSFISGSSNVGKVEYDPDEKTLDVTFKKSGLVYRYFDVKRSVFAKLEEAEAQEGSCGKLFNESVKNGGFRYEQVA